MSHPVTWFQIQGPSGDPLKAFYQSVFGWQMQSLPDGTSMVPPQGGGIAGGVGASRDGSSNVSVFIEVDELSEALAKISGAGGTPAMEPMDLGDMGRIAGFLDPAHNWVGIWAPPLGMSREEFAAKNAPPPLPKPKAAKKKSAPKKKAPAKKAKKAAPKKKAKAGKKKRR